MAVHGESRRHGRYVEPEPVGEHLVDLDALTADQALEHLRLVGPHLVLAPFVGLEGCAQEVDAALRQFVHRFVVGFQHGSAVGPHVVAVEGDAPRRRLFLCIGRRERTLLVDRDALPEDIEPVGIDTGLAVACTARQRRRDGEMGEVGLRLQQPCGVLLLYVRAQRVEVDVVPVFPAGGVDEQLSLRDGRSGRHFIVDAVENAAAGCRRQ